eukprot:Nitzschia sp. Nitz4//scaffold255_size41878//30550//31146//NITZ4_007410-RA/size41878-processed-gene-0.66-mRNA-1//-1//CDS//3329544386//45//frame0
MLLTASQTSCPLFPEWVEENIERVGGCSPPMEIIVRNRGESKVRFSENVETFEYQMLSGRSDSSLWYTESELAAAAPTDEYDPEEPDLLCEAITYNHIRRVLLSFQSFQQIGGGNSSLRAIARQSSKRSVARARQRAVLLSKELDTSREPVEDADVFGLGCVNPHITDFYMETVLEFLTPRIPSWWSYPCSGDRRRAE